MPYKDVNDSRLEEYRRRRVEAVYKWRRETKERIIKSMGGCCQICSYDRCASALELHHIDPEQKEFSFGHIMAQPKNLEELINEVKKCILLCANCHREYHAGLVDIPNTFFCFDESVMRATAAVKKQAEVAARAYARRNEVRADRRKIKLTDEEFLSMLALHGNNSKLARALGVSETCIRKRKKLVAL